MSAFNFSDDVLFRFEQACSLGQEAEKEISLKPKDAALYLDIFETSLKENPAANPELVQARDVFKRLAEGEVVTLYDSEKLPADKKASDIFQQTIGRRGPNYVDVKFQGVDWLETARNVVQTKKIHLERARGYIEQAGQSSDATTIAELKEAAAREYISLGMHETAFELRAQIAQLSFPADHCLSDIDQAVAQGSKGKPHPRMGAYFQDLDTGCVKRGTLHASKRRMVQISFDPKEEPQEAFCFDFYLTHYSRNELDKAVQLIEEHPKEAESISGHPIHVRRGIATVLPSYIQEKDVYASDIGYKFSGGLEIEIEGIGKVCIHTDPAQHSLYNRIEIILDAQANLGPNGLKNLHAILSLLGLGTTLCPSRPEDEMRMKLFSLLHAFFPTLSYQMERDPANYTISTKELLQKICSKEPGAKAIFTKYLETNPELFVKEELYSGRQAYMIKDMGDQIREHACGLIFGTKSSVCTRIPWKNPDSAIEQFRKIASLYVMKLKAGVAMESNREDWLCLGDVKSGTTATEDIVVGGFDSVFTRLFPKIFVGQEILPCVPFCQDGIRVLIDSDVMGYASVYAYRGDQFGARVDYDPWGNPADAPDLRYSGRPGLPEFARQIQDLGKHDVIPEELTEDLSSTEVKTATSNEVMIRDVIPSKFVRGLLVKRQVMKDILVEELRKAGLVQKRGEIEYVVLPGCEKQLDAFIYVGDECQSEMWAKPTVPPPRPRRKILL